MEITPGAARPPDPGPPGTLGPPGPLGPPEVEVAALLGAAREAVLVHAGARYRLRVTASGKLILTK